MNLEGGNDGGGAAMIRVGQAAAMLSVSTRTVWRMIADGQLTAVRFRRCTRVALAEVQKYVQGVRRVEFV